MKIRKQWFGFLSGLGLGLLISLLINKQSILIFFGMLFIILSIGLDVIKQTIKTKGREMLKKLLGVEQSSGK